MKRVFLVAAIAVAHSAFAADAAPEAAPAPTTTSAPVDEGKLAYSIGFFDGKKYQADIPNMNIERYIAGLKNAMGGKQPSEGTDPFSKGTDPFSIGFTNGKSIQEDIPNMNIERYIAGLKDAMGGKQPSLSVEEMSLVLTAFDNRLSQKNKTKGEAYLAENVKKPGVKTTASGLQYEVLREGTGVSPKATDAVEVRYDSRLVDGTVIENGIARNQTITFELDKLMPGFAEGIQLMKKGAKYRLVIPADKDFGEMARGPIPPNSVLVFEVELIDINKAASKSELEVQKKEEARRRNARMKSPLYLQAKSYVQQIKMQSYKCQYMMDAVGEQMLLGYAIEMSENPLGFKILERMANDFLEKCRR